MTSGVNEITLSKHATGRALDMGVSGEEIRQALLYPEGVFESHKYEDTKNYQAGRIVLAVRGSTVVTGGLVLRGFVV